MFDNYATLIAVQRETNNRIDDLQESIQTLTTVNCALLIVCICTMLLSIIKG